MNSEHLVLSVLAEIDALPAGEADDHERREWAGRLERAQQRMRELLASIAPVATGDDAKHLLAKQVEVLRREAESRAGQLEAVIGALEKKRAEVAEVGQHADEVAASIRETERQVQRVCQTLTSTDPALAADSASLQRQSPQLRRGQAQARGLPAKATAQPAAPNRRQLETEIKQLLEAHPDLALLHKELDKRLAGSPTTLQPRGSSNAELERWLERALARQEQEQRRMGEFGLPVSRAIAERAGQAELLRWTEGEAAALGCWLQFNGETTRRAQEQMQALQRRAQRQEEEPTGADHRALRAEQSRWLEGEIEGRRRLRGIVNLWAQRMSAEIAEQEEELARLG